MRIRTVIIVALLVGVASAQQSPAPSKQGPGAAPQGAATQQAQTAQGSSSLDLVGALKRAYGQGTELANAQTNLQNAQLQLKALEADPSTLVLQKTQAQQAVALDEVTVEATRLSVLQSVVSDYLALYEAQQNVALAKAQLDLASKNLQVAEAKFQDGNATSLDVSKARTAQQSAQQTLADAEAKVPVAEAQLANLLGVTNLGSVTVAPPPSFPKVDAKLADLETGLLQRLPKVVQARQSVALYTLQVKLYDNDYTPRLTLQTAKSSLDTAQRSLDTSQQNASTSLANAYQTAVHAYANIAISQQNLANTENVLKQDQAALEAGTVAALQVQTDQVSLASARFGLLQAEDTYRNALVTLSVSCGQDLTGLLKAASSGAGASS